MSRITINGKTIITSGKILIVDGDNIICDGDVIGTGLSGIVEIIFEGDLASLKCDCGVTINGNVHGDVSAGSGVKCGDVGGNVRAGSSVDCDNVQGDVRAGSSITMKRSGIRDTDTMRDTLRGLKDRF